MAHRAEVKIYATAWCPYCIAARELFERKGVDYDEVDLALEPQRRAEMRELSGRSSVPQIFIGGRHYGGYDDVRALDERGELDGLLGLPAGVTQSNDNARQGKT